MNSIKPTISADPSRAAVASFAVAALAIIVLGVTQTMASAAGAQSAALLQAAELQPRGADRDSLLASAHEAAHDAIGFAPNDPAPSSREARILYLQATTASVQDVSLPLLDAAKTSAERVLKMTKDDAAATALLALIEMGRIQAPTRGAADLVARSYAGRARLPEAALWRGEAAAGAWSLLRGADRITAATEICALQRSGAYRPKARAIALQIDAAMGYPARTPEDAARVCGLSNAEIAASIAPPAEPEEKVLPASPKAENVNKKPGRKRKGR